VYAPGSSITSASIDDSTASTTKSGTSMASPRECQSGFSVFSLTRGA
jgi:hypothetical protein